MAEQYYQVLNPFHTDLTQCRYRKRPLDIYPSPHQLPPVVSSLSHFPNHAVNMHIFYGRCAVKRTRSTHVVRQVRKRGEQALRLETRMHTSPLFISSCTILGKLLSLSLLHSLSSLTWTAEKITVLALVHSGYYQGLTQYCSKSTQHNAQHIISIQ